MLRILCSIVLMGVFALTWAETNEPRTSRQHIKPSLLSDQLKKLELPMLSPAQLAQVVEKKSLHVQLPTHGTKMWILTKYKEVLVTHKSGFMWNVEVVKEEWRVNIFSTAITLALLTLAFFSGKEFGNFFVRPVMLGMILGIVLPIFHAMLPEGTVQLLFLVVSLFTVMILSGISRQLFQGCSAMVLVSQTLVWYIGIPITVEMFLGLLGLCTMVSIFELLVAYIHVKDPGKDSGATPIIL